MNSNDTGKGLTALDAFLTAVVIWAIVIAAAVSLSCAAGPRLLTLSVKEQYNSVTSVSVTCATPNGPAIQLGTAVLVSDHQAITANHVINCPGAQITLAGALGPIPMRVEERNVDADIVRLGAIEGFPFDGHPIQIGLRPAAGDTVCLISAVPRIGRRCGQVQWYKGPVPGDIMHDAITEPGNSGGPVYNTDGELVGIVTHLWFCSNGQICGGLATSLHDRDWIMP